MRISLKLKFTACKTDENLHRERLLSGSVAGPHHNISWSQHSQQIQFQQQLSILFSTTEHCWHHVLTKRWSWTAQLCRTKQWNAQDVFIWVFKNPIIFSRVELKRIVHHSFKSVVLFLLNNTTIQLIFTVKLNPLFRLYLLVFKWKCEVPVLLYVSRVTPLKSKGIICALQEDKLTVSLANHKTRERKSNSPCLR